MSEQNESEHSYPTKNKNKKMQKTHMRGRDTKHQSIFINVTIIVYNDSLKHEDPNESLGRPKH